MRITANLDYFSHFKWTKQPWLHKNQQTSERENVINRSQQGVLHETKCVEEKENPTKQ